MALALSFSSGVISIAKVRERERESRYCVEKLRWLGGLGRVIDGGNDREKKDHKAERQRAGRAVNNID